MAPVLVCVEGNIGSGKSTLLSRLRDAVEVFPEPVEEWTELLTKFYDNPSQWGLAMSLKVLLSFAAPLKSGRSVVVVERSPMSARHVFTQLLFNDGKMTQEEWSLYKDYNDVLGWTPSLIVYVHTPPEECYARMRQRNREAEASVDMQYIKRLDFQYETMLRYAGVPVVRLDGTEDPDFLARALVDIVARAESKAAEPPAGASRSLLTRA